MGWGFFVLRFNILIKKETKDKSIHEFVFFRMWFKYLSCSSGLICEPPKHILFICFLPFVFVEEVNEQ